MATVREIEKEVSRLPERELAFERMIERGLQDSRKGRVISNEDMEHRIRLWQR